MTVLQNLMFPLLNVKEMTKEEKREKALTAAEILGLTPILSESAPGLGPADRQRTALGRALVRKPNIFLFDEPLSSIEPDQRSLLKTKIKETQQELQQTSVYVTHDQTEALTFAEKVAIMDMGRIAQYDTVENIYEKPSNTFVAFFVGFPGMNILEGTLKENKILLKDFDVEIPEKTRLPKSLTEVKVGIRPEHIEISTEKKRGWIPFKSELFENLGKGFGVLHLATKNHQITARSTFSVPPGSDIWVNFPTNYLHLFNPEGKRLDT